MIAKTFAAALLASALTAPAYAQAGAGTTDVAAELAALRARITQLEGEVAALKTAPVQAAPTELAAPQAAPAAGQMQTAPAAAPAEAPSWKGAPEFTHKSGFSFKPRGMIQLDAGFVGTPGPTRAGVVGGLDYDNLGWNTRARRILFGAQGKLPGGFGYTAEFDFAQGQVNYEDIILTYQADKSPLLVTIGNFYPFSSLDTMTSSRVTSFLERATLTDAFGYNRRLGVGITWSDVEDDEYVVHAGLFSQEINNSSFNRTGWQASVRGVYAPKLGETRLHVGANFQHRVAQQDAQNVRYRARPLTQLTDQRFIDTGAIAADGDDILGLELGAIRGPFHFAAEAQQVWVRGFRPGETFGANNGVDGGLFYADDPRFRSAYGEIGFYFTGETRGYKNGRWDRTKVLRGFDKGGWGALQANLRVDYVDLGDRVAGTSLSAPDFVNGGRQLGYQASLIWNPTDYLRFMAQYGRANYQGGPRAGTVVPGSTAPVDERSFDVDTVGVRAQVDF
jgi:phosphate-selective porin OprO and OprP